MSVTGKWVNNPSGPETPSITPNTNQERPASEEARLSEACKCIRCVGQFLAQTFRNCNGTGYQSAYSVDNAET